MRAEEKDPLVVDPLEAVALDEPEKLTYISTVLASEEKEQLRHVLLGNKDIFAWSRLDMAGIDPTLASHKLNVIATTKLVRQKVRRPDRHRIIQIEMDKLLSAGFIREVKYPEWLANVVVILNKGGKWRVCVDYTNLNEACPMDSFPLPRINKIVDASARHGMPSFLFSGHHKIPMYLPNVEKTTFIMPHGYAATT